ncbi:MAG: right-handed parallel beta-helix repeat-containing protein [Acidimicrobiia bacterium]
MVLVAVVTAVLVPLAAVPASAGVIISVPGAHATIQEAIDAAVNGNTVVVDDGTYDENITFFGKAIEVRSVTGSDNTVLHGSVTFEDGETNASVLRGFTIQNTSNAITLESASPTITENVIVGNSKAVTSIGSTAAPMIIDNVIADNFVCGGTPGITMTGGGIIRDNLILDNFVTCSAGLGGGISIPLGSGALIEGNLIAGNYAIAGGGIDVRAGADNVTIKDNVIVANAADFGNGGGLSITDSRNAVVAQNLVAFNDGGGITLSPDGNGPLTTGLVLVNNTTGDNFGFDFFGNPVPGIQSHRNDLGFPKFYNNIASDGLTCTGDHSGGTFFSNNFLPFLGGVCRPQLGTNGNIELNPKFRNPDDLDYALRSDSPSRDTGNGSPPNPPSLPATDITGRSRVVNGTVDQGAIEFYIPKGASEPEVWDPAPEVLRKDLPPGVFTTGGASVGAAAPGPAAASSPSVKSEPTILATVTDPTTLSARRQAMRNARWRARHAHPKLG